MSNHMETRTRSKTKAPKLPVQENVPENLPQQYIDNQPPETEEEELNNHQNKKLKTENNSKSNNIYLLPSTGGPKNFHGSLSLLKTFAAENEAL